MGDFIVSVPVRIENTATFGGEDRGIPLAGGDPNEGEDQTDPEGRQLARRVFNAGTGGNRALGKANDRGIAARGTPLRFEIGGACRPWLAKGAASRRGAPVWS